MTCRPEPIKGCGGRQGRPPAGRHSRVTRTAIACRRRAGIGLAHPMPIPAPQTARAAAECSGAGFPPTKRRIALLGHPNGFLACRWLFALHRSQIRRWPPGRSWTRRFRAGYPIAVSFRFRSTPTRSALLPRNYRRRRAGPAPALRCETATALRRLSRRGRQAISSAPGA